LTEKEESAGEWEALSRIPGRGAKCLANFRPGGTSIYCCQNLKNRSTEGYNQGKKNDIMEPALDEGTKTSWWKGDKYEGRTL